MADNAAKDIDCCAGLLIEREARKDTDRRVGVLEEIVQAINDKLTTWVNPVIAVVISVLCALLGFAGGVIAVLSRG